ncbi:MAG: DUF349 domain-containing protein [Bacteroidales bacterium]|nr:DUF349 domain-containing protein [Bacteroidales bacterium]
MTNKDLLPDEKEKKVSETPDTKEDKNEQKLTEDAGEEVTSPQASVISEDVEATVIEESVEEPVVAKESVEEPVVAKEAVDDPATHPAGEEKEAKETKETKDDLPPLGVDYSNFGKEELVEALQALLDRRSIQDIRNEVENIKSAFYKKHRQIIEEKKAAFLKDGGSEEEFRLADDPLEDEYKELYSSYRQRRIEYNKVLEAEKYTNLAKKREIIDKIKNLVHSQESLNKTFNEFRDLQNDWREAGPVPQNELASLWENYHHHVEKFYDFIKINRELRDLDLKKNMESKILLCERAEELLLEPSIVKAFRDLQELHGRWREIGPVPREKRDELWERFRETTTLINKKHQGHFQELKDEQKKNLEAKVRLCEEVEELLEARRDSPRKWNDMSHKVVELQKLWRTIGFAPKKDNNRIYERFRKLCDEFFNRKREFFTQHRNEQNNNLQAKTDLCIQSEALAQSTDWKQTTEDLIDIQKKWKKIGAVPRKYSDALWLRFRTACDAFFVNKQKHFVGEDSAQVENLQKKYELIDKVKAFKLGDDSSKDLETLKRFQKEFTSIGHVPFNKKNEVQHTFREAINNHFDKLDIDESKRELLNFRQKIDNIAQSPKSRNRLYTEREKLAGKLKQLESDIILWENNIGFFSKSKSSESMIKDVESKIEAGKKRIKSLKERIDMIDNYNV